MGIYRTYFDKNNTIIKNSEINTGRNPVSELYYGNNVSRFLFYCSFNEIKEKILNKDIIINNNIRHILKIKNTASVDIQPILSNDNNLMFGDKIRASSFDLELRPIVGGIWDEGVGYDFQKNILSNVDGRNFNQQPSNWFNSTTINQFQTPGGDLGPVIGTQHLDKGNEDIEIDITNFVNNVINNTNQNYFGFCLKYTNDYEVFNDLRTFVFGLFTRHTQTFFEPFIETHYDDLIDDNRSNFYISKRNRLFFYSVIDGELTNLDTMPTVNIIAPNDTLNPEAKQLSRGVYYFDILLGTQFETFVEYNDVWGNLFLNGVRLPDVKLSFVPLDDRNYIQLGTNIVDTTNYGISVSGIKRDENLTQGTIKRVNIHLRKPYTVNESESITNVFYRLYIKHGTKNINIVDWTKCSRTFDKNFFTVDTTWLIPQDYYIDLKVINNGQVSIHNNITNFSVITFNN